MDTKSIDQLSGRISDRNGRILENKLFEFLSGQSEVKGVKSVSTPIAQTKNLCVPRNLPEQNFSRILGQLGKMKAENKLLYFLTEVMINGGCRVSEALDIEPKDIKSTGHIMIRGKKGSNDRIITVADGKEYFLQCRVNNVRPFEIFNRFYVYREFKKYGINFQFKGKQKRSVTHAIRQLTLRTLQNEGENINTRKKLSGHKSNKSMQYYEDH